MQRQMCLPKAGSEVVSQFQHCFRRVVSQFQHCQKLKTKDWRVILLTSLLTRNYSILIQWVNVWPKNDITISRPQSLNFYFPRLLLFCARIYFNFHSAFPNFNYKWRDIFWFLTLHSTKCFTYVCIYI